MLTNKNAMQILCGALLLVSFFVPWVYSGNIFYFQPLEEIMRSDGPLAYKLFWLLPVMGVLNIALGVKKEFDKQIVCDSLVICTVIIVCVVHYSGIYNNHLVSVYIGFYATSVAVITFVLSVILPKRRFKLWKKRRRKRTCDKSSQVRTKGRRSSGKKSTKRASSSIKKATNGPNKSKQSTTKKKNVKTRSPVKSKAKKKA
ncbi:hypothetical protein [Bacillus bombysepticus]|uniref:hypothetical protein n=1 Tax=Bacillus bombysepticus TaxID=658666 RepID=UPI00301B4B5F